MNAEDQVRCIYKLIRDAIECDIDVTKPVKKETCDVRLGCEKNTITSEIPLCMICLDSKDDYKYTKLGSCGHSFHKSCVELYIFSEMNRRSRKCNRNKLVRSYSVRCPLCRRISRTNVEKKMIECEMVLRSYII